MRDQTASVFQIFSHSSALYAYYSLVWCKGQTLYCRLQNWWSVFVVWQLEYRWWDGRFHVRVEWSITCLSRKGPLHVRQKRKITELMSLLVNSHIGFENVINIYLHPGFIACMFAVCVPFLPRGLVILWLYWYILCDTLFRDSVDIWNDEPCKEEKSWIMVTDTGRCCYSRIFSRTCYRNSRWIIEINEYTHSCSTEAMTQEAVEWAYEY